METTLLIITGVSLVATAAAGWIAWRLWREERLRSEARVALLAEMAHPSVTTAATVGGEIFHTAAAASAWPRRAAIAVAMVAVVALGVAGFRAMSPTAAPTDVVIAAPQPLELLTLAHAREGDVLVVSGRVQNPREGVTRARVVVTAALVDAKGSMLSDGRAPLDIARLEPGDESQFAIRISAPATVARYRVSFRSADGRPLAHVDRRDASLARKEAP